MAQQKTKEETPVGQMMGNVDQGSQIGMLITGRWWSASGTRKWPSKEEDGKGSLPAPCLG